MNQNFQSRRQQQPVTPGQQNNRAPYKQAQFDPIPMTYTELLPQLIQNHQLAPKPVAPLQPPYPRWYDPNARCDYHAGAVGHSTENCTALKYRVQELIKAGWLNFKKEEGPNVDNNPLPNHQVNAIDQCQDIIKKADVTEIKTPKEKLFEILLVNGYVSIEYAHKDLVQEEFDDNLTCLFHAGAKGHSLEQCHRFHKRIQELVDSKFLVVAQAHHQDNEIGVVEELLPKENLNPSFKLKPLTIYYREKTTTHDPKSITIQVPTPFKYKSSKAVPWSYEYKVTINSKTPTLPVDNISGMGGVTLSGKCYTPDQLLKCSKNIIEEKNEKVENNTDSNV
ncbi:hypothetical protein NP118_23425, partial [Salmonella enterica]|nr:hypothetical protein [Salmonella enterica]